ncbi:hypothetical protein Syun_025035 [Stephania yunnanensis]|uniref:Uncharacterized protein n=1 Tax=Stephania yunnanensis TaxID=152371 RepID=A0AAP0EQV8_9MAGN
MNKEYIYIYIICYILILIDAGAGAGVPSNKSKGVASALSARKTIAKKTEQASRHQQPSLVNIGNKDHSIRTRDLHTNQTVQQPLNNGRPEMVKHMVHFNSCISSGPHRGVEYNKCPPSSEAAKPKSLLNNNLVCSPAK